MSFYQPYSSVNWLRPAAGRTLIVSPSQLDEAILAQPLIASLRRDDPYGRIDCLCHAAVAPIFSAMVEVDTVLISTVPDERLALWERIQLARRLAQRRYDVALILPQPKTAAIAPWLAGIALKVGRQRPNRRNGLGQQPEAGRFSRVHRYGSLARWFASLSATDQAFVPATGDESDPARAGTRTALRAREDPGMAAPLLTLPPTLQPSTQRRLALSPQTPLFLFAAGSEYGTASRWPARHFVALASLIRLAWPGARVAAIGRSEERELGRHLHLLSGGAIENWMGTLALDETMALMVEATGIVANDSALLHLAAALGCVHVALFGAGDPELEPANGSQRRVIWLPQACSPCLQPECRFGHLDCLMRLTPQAVMAALTETHGLAPPSAPASRLVD